MSERSKSEGTINRFWPISSICLFLLLWLPQSVFAHGGGYPHLSNVQAGPFVVSAWTQPTPWRLDQLMHMDIAVIGLPPNAQGAQPPIAITDATVLLTLTQSDQPAHVITTTASLSEQFGGLYYEAAWENLPSAGDWLVNLAVTGQQGVGSTEFTITVMPSEGINWWLVGGGLMVMGVLIGAAVALLRATSGTG